MMDRCVIQEGAVMPVLHADFVIHAPDGRFVAAVEVKNRESLTPEVAEAIRRNMAAHGQLPAAEFFLLVSQDVGYLWRQGDANGGRAAIPFPMKEVIQRYAPSAVERLRGDALDVVIQAWLFELQREGEPHTPADKTLAAVGFVDAIRNGTWTWETA
jgi:hypothetical protein